MSADGHVDAGAGRADARPETDAREPAGTDSPPSAKALPGTDGKAAGKVDIAALRRELKANRKSVASLQRDHTAILYDLGRHVSNLGLDAGYDELAQVIKKTRTIRDNLDELEEELQWVSKVATEHDAMRGDLDRTRDEAKALYATLDASIVELGAHAHRVHQSAEIGAEFRAFLGEMIERDDEWRPAIVDDIPDARMGIRARLRSLKERFEPKVDPTRGLYPRIGWRLLRASMDERCEDSELRQAVAAAKKGVSRLLELERHQRYREDNLAEFESEMRDSWGYENIASMVEDLERQREEMRESVEGFYLEIGTTFNTHRLHDYVQDSFVKSCRRRIKRLHVRTNALRLRQRDVLRALKQSTAAPAPDRGEIKGA